MQSGQPDTGASSYPPPVYAVPEDRRSAPPAGILWWIGATVLLGVVLGASWWLLAPTGRLFGDPLDPTQWPGRDLTLAGLQLVAGIAVGGIVATRLAAPGVVARVVAVVGGSVLGSLLSVVVGQGLALLLGPDGREDVPGSAFLLHSYGALALWPGVVALIVFLTALIGLARRRA